MLCLPELLKLPEKLNISSASESLLGLSSLRPKRPTTTVYLLLGDGCTGSCGFCSMGSHRGLERPKQGSVRLSRVDWPSRPTEVVLEALKGLAAASEQGFRPRVCLQAVQDRRDQVLALLQQILPFGFTVSVSAHVRHRGDVEDYISAGADRVGISLDAATWETYRMRKRPDLSSDEAQASFVERIELILQCAQDFPGHITTHLIRGLGEDEADFFRTLSRLTARGALVGLFAFTPLPATPMQDSPRPDPGSYRRIQLASFLLSAGFPEECFSLRDRRIADLLLTREQRDRLIAMISDGTLRHAFRTSGCPDCNRPYYNDSPMETPYNFAGPLTSAEFTAALYLADLPVIHCLNPHVLI